MSRKLIAGIIFGFLWGSIAYAYAVAINTQGLFTSSYSFIFFQWTVLLPYTLLLNTPGINMLALGISALYALLSTAIYAAALILFLQYVFKRIFIIFHFKKQIFYFVIGLSFVAIALVVTFLDHYQK